MPDFSSLGATVWGISPQDQETHRSFAERQSLSVPLLSDIDKKVGSAYGVLGPLGFYRRSVFVINRQGVVTFCHRTTAGLTYLPTSTLLEAVRDAEAASS
jgi:peroxiredoxin